MSHGSGASGRRRPRDTGGGYNHTSPGHRAVSGPTGDGTRLSRRRLLAGVAGVGATAATAGCANVINWLADQALGAVNLFNETGDPVAGQIEIVGPGGDPVLDERFQLEGKVEDEATAEATAAYEDVWEGTGTYDVAVELAEGSAIDGEAAASRTVEITQPDEEMLAVALGAEEEAAPIYFAVATEFTGFQS